MMLDSGGGGGEAGVGGEAVAVPAEGLDLQVEDEEDLYDDVDPYGTCASWTVVPACGRVVEV